MRLIWTDSNLIIQDPVPGIESGLHYYHKSLEWSDEKKDRQVVSEKVELFVRTPEGHISTYQGFLDLIISTCKKKGWNYELKDCREEFPKPDLSKLGGFRHFQRYAVLTMLSAKRSCLMSAPTRSGKTIILGNILRAFPGLPSVVAAPGVNLLGQLVDELCIMMPDREIKGIFTGSGNRKPSDDITVTSLDSLHKVDCENTRLLIVDEANECVSETRSLKLAKFTRARILGFGATLTGRFDGADMLLTGLVGPVVFKKTFPEAVAEGAICPIIVYIIEITFEPFKCYKRDGAYRDMIYANQWYDGMIKQICDSIIPAYWQTLIFLDEQKQAALMERFVEDASVAIACQMTTKERKEHFVGMADGTIKRCLATEIYARGVTFKDLRVVINACGGGASTSNAQRPGRLAQIRPGKTAGYLIDFIFKPKRTGNNNYTAWEYVVRDGQKRVNYYRSIGYEVRTVSKIEEIKLE